MPVPALDGWSFTASLRALPGARSQIRIGFFKESFVLAVSRRFLRPIWYLKQTASRLCEQLAML